MKRLFVFVLLVGVLLGSLALLFPVFSNVRERGRVPAPAAASAGGGGGVMQEIRGEGVAGQMKAMKQEMATMSASRRKQPHANAASTRATLAPMIQDYDESAAVRPPAADNSDAMPVPMGMAGRPTVAGRVAPPAMAQGAAARANPNFYISNTYMGGSGEKDRIEKLIAEGVMVDGKRVKLEAFSRTYAQTFPIPTRTALNVVADTEHSKIVQQGDRTFLQVGLQAIKGELPRRPPLNVAVVIDRSGSMADDEKLVNAKAAAEQLVDRLGPEDVFSLVAFDDTVSLLVPAQHVTNKARVKAKIAALEPGGSTDIYSGLQTAFQQAQKNVSNERVSRVILLSDGQVTAGVNDPQQFQKLVAANADRDIQTTAVGLGVEFDEDLMMQIARDGQGNFHFIKDGSDTQTVFAKELDELTHIVAKAVKLRIKLADGIGLVRVLGADTLDAAETRQVKAEEKKIDRKVAEELGITANRQNDRDEPGIKLLIPNFYRGDSHVVMMELQIPRGAGTRKVADVYLKYKDLVGRANRTGQVAANITYTADRATEIASLNRSVKKNLLGFQTGEALQQAAALMDSGRAGEAVRKVDERMAVLGVAAREWHDRDLDRDGILLDRYKTVLAQVARNRQLADGDIGQYLKRSLTYAAYKMTR